MYLLDNDVFLAAIYAGHEFHRPARKWLDGRKGHGWGIAAETWLAAVRLLMNPAVMGSGVLSARDAILAVKTELAGPQPGMVVLPRNPPEASRFTQAEGHRQVMDLWLVQIAHEHNAKLVTRDRGSLFNWPDDTVAVR